MWKNNRQRGTKAPCILSLSDTGEKHRQWGAGGQQEGREELRLGKYCRCSNTDRQNEGMRKRERRRAGASKKG